MGRKKKKQLKPWCWYCNREFDDEKILIQHQKSKHFKCTFCHKKLYTGPGLSIHSMQVHKEKIDKIPYALPNRSNVDLEIYGMEGIPEEDIKEHERNKSGKEDEVEEKRIKLEIPPILPTFPMHAIPMAPGLPYMPPMAVSVMPPIQFGLAPPIFVTRPTMTGILAPPVTKMIGPVAIPQPNRVISSPIIFNPNDDIKISNNIPPPPPPPPSCSSSTSSADTSVASTPHTPTFPAYSGNQESSKVILKVAKPTSSTPNIKVVLVHPEDDIPLEQIRLRLPRYSSFLNVVSASSDLSWTKSSQPPPQVPRSLHELDCKMIPPPPPPGQAYNHPHAAAALAASRHWVAPHIIHFARPLNFGGPGF